MMHIGSLSAGFANSSSFGRGIRPMPVRTLPLPMSNRFDSLPEHIQRPQVRRFLPEVRPAKAKDQSGKEHDVALLILQDPLRLAPQPFILPLQGLQQQQIQQQVQQWMGFLMNLDGDSHVEEVFDRLKVPVEAQEQLVQMIQKLDELGYLWGPTSEALEKAKLDAIRAAGAFTLPEEARKPEVAQQLKAFIADQLAKAEDPELGATVVGIVAPHLDYGRAGSTYAAAYKCLETGAKERPDRVVILGTNHFGLGDGVVMSEFGFESPLGTVRPDATVLERLRDAFGERLFKDQIDMAAEHSIALHVPWLQHLYGDVPVVAALVPDPNVAMVSDDGARVGTKEFAVALKSILSQAGGRTIFVSSADLSHVGPQFGDQAMLDAKRKHSVEEHDRSLLGEFIANPDQFVQQMAKAGNPNRWCSVGNLYATATCAPHATREMVQYDQAADPNGAGMVTSAALAFLA
jgi:AmmeMemoRadiSam system protein B